jgi:hypothetical protein
MSGKNWTVAVRGGEAGSYMSWFNGGNSFGIGKAFPAKFQDLTSAHTGPNRTDFLEMELRAEGDQLTLTIDQNEMCTARDNLISKGTFNVRALNGITRFKRIEVRILDK